MRYGPARWRERQARCFEVADAEVVTGELVDAGAELVAPPTVTPWDSLNARVQAPGNLQVTVFQELAGPGAGGSPGAP